MHSIIHRRGHFFPRTRFPYSACSHRNTCSPSSLPYLSYHKDNARQSTQDSKQHTAKHATYNGKYNGNGDVDRNMWTTALQQNAPKSMNNNSGGERRNRRSHMRQRQIELEREQLYGDTKRAVKKSEIVLTRSLAKAKTPQQLKQLIADHLIDITIAVDKPAGITSYDALTQLKWIVFDSVVLSREPAIRGNRHLLRSLFRRFKCGHAGTLDPMATGLMLMMLGDQGVKRTTMFQNGEKTYLFGMQLGKVTHSYDCTSPACIEADPMLVKSITFDQMNEVAQKHFVGQIAQRVPLISAVKVNGERLYKRLSESKEKFTSWESLREIQEAWCPVKEVNISELQCQHFDAETSESIWRVRSSSGTYVRSIIHDMGEKLDRVGAYMTSLRREQIGQFAVDDAWTLEELRVMLGSETPIPLEIQ